MKKQAQNKMIAAATLEEGEAGEELVYSAKKMAKIKDIYQQRVEFSNLRSQMKEPLSEALITGEIYKRFCPMAFQGRRDYWLSNLKEIKIPYSGDKMLAYGRVAESLNPS